jgi:hypothetical protein
VSLSPICRFIVDKDPTFSLIDLPRSATFASFLAVALSHRCEVGMTTKSDKTMKQYNVSINAVEGICLRASVGIARKASTVSRQQMSKVHRREEFKDAWESTVH